MLIIRKTILTLKLKFLMKQMPTMTLVVETVGDDGTGSLVVIDNDTEDDFFVIDDVDNEI